MRWGLGARIIELERQEAVERAMAAIGRIRPVSNVGAPHGAPHGLRRASVAGVAP
jgi:hypothetical protein